VAAVLFLLQVTVAHRFSTESLRFDLLYLLAAYLALEARPEAALVCACAIGILRDLGSGGRLGASAVVMVLGAAGLLVLRDRIYREKIVTDVVLVFGFVLFCGTLRAGGVALASASAGWFALMQYALGQAALTAALAPLFFRLFDRLRVVEREGALLA